MTDHTRSGASRTELAGLVGFPVAKLLLHLATLSGYGYFRDELYYLASTAHLAPGFVDHPPFSILLLALASAVLGDSVPAIRVVPALAGALTVLLVGLTARRLGGKAFAQSVAMASVLAAPLYLGLHHVYSMNALDILVWTAAGYGLLAVLDRPTSGRWALLGILLGLGLQNKISVLWLGAGLAVALLATRRGRGLLKTPGPWLAGALALLLFLPYVVWNAVHDWPALEFMANAAGGKMITRSPVTYLVELATAMNPLTVPVWTAGILFLFLGGTSVDGKEPREGAGARGGPREEERHGVRRGELRLLGWTAATVLAILVFAGSARTAYAAAGFTWLFAAGGPGLDDALARLVPGGMLRVARGGLLVLILASGALLAPFGLPVLPVEEFVAYQRALGLEPSTEERHEMGALPQFYADMQGWEVLVDQVERAYLSLAPEERSEAVVFGQNYGEAAAVDVLGRARGLPPAVSGHNAYWMWGPGAATGEVVIVLGDDRATLEGLFTRVERAGTVDCTYCMPYEDGLPVWIGRGLRGGLAAIWTSVKHYD